MGGGEDRAAGMTGKNLAQGGTGSSNSGIMVAMRPDESSERRWAAQWRAAGPALARVREEELARLSEADALAAAHTLLAVAAGIPVPRERLVWSGLIKLQRQLRRAR